MASFPNPPVAPEDIAPGEALRLNANGDGWEVYTPGGGDAVSGYPPAAGVNPFAQGSIADGGTITTPGAYAKGSFAQGYARDSGSIASSGFGSFAQGFSYNADSVILASYPGAFAQGYAQTGGSITASSFGCFAQGYSSAAGVLSSTGTASFAQGFIGNNGGTITATNEGSFAQGIAANGGSITSSAPGSFAQGIANTGTITSSENGSFAQGYVLADQTIAATATNAAQFGPGTNAQHDSLQIGSAGVRLLGKAGLADAPQNGDIYVDANGNLALSNGGLAAPSLPATDPHVLNQLYTTAGAVMVSAG